MKYSTQVSRGAFTEMTTVDGRDLSREEFRVIPGFSRYEMTKDGDIRNIRTGRLLTELENKKTGAWSYCLWKDDGKSTHRNWEKLMHLAYPEEKPEELSKEPKRRYSKRGGWTDIPGFEGKYQAHPEGLVRYTASRRRLKIDQDCLEFFVILRREDGAHRITISKVLRNTFPVMEEQEAA